MFYLYHIKGVKWGCTKRSVKRRVWEQGYTINDVCEIIEILDKQEASELEDNLNIKYGYKRDPNKYAEIDYSAIAKLSSFTNKQRSKGGKTASINLANWCKKNNAKKHKENPHILKNFIEGGRKCNEKKKRPVLQYDLNGNLIAEYSSRNEAKRAIGKQIHHALKNSTKTAGGFIWKYKHISLKKK